MTEPSHPMRPPHRRDRAVTDENWIRAFLREAPFGVLATENDGQPHLHPLVFAYDRESGAICFHGGRAGQLFSNVQANPRVCFNAAVMGSPVAGSRACDFDVEYESVTVYGEVRIIEDEEEAVRTLRLLLDKYYPELQYGRDYQPIPRERLAETAVYCLQISSWSGKRNVPEA